jgi:hypothetical protein
MTLQGRCNIPATSVKQVYKWQTIEGGLWDRPGRMRPFAPFSTQVTENAAENRWQTKITRTRHPFPGLRLNS